MRKTNLKLSEFDKLIFKAALVTLHLSDSTDACIYRRVYSFYHSLQLTFDILCDYCVFSHVIESCVVNHGATLLTF